MQGRGPQATHCGQSSSHAQPGACLGATRPPRIPNQFPLPSKSSIPAYHPQGSSILPESRRPRPGPYLTAHSSPLSLHPCNPLEPRTHSLAGGVWGV